MPWGVLSQFRPLGTARAPIQQLLSNFASILARSVIYTASLLPAVLVTRRGESFCEGGLRILAQFRPY